MLTLARRVGEKIVIEHGRVVIEVVSMGGGEVKLAFTADRMIPINRAEVEQRYESKHEEARQRGAVERMNARRLA